jgi:ribonuclease R
MEGTIININNKYVILNVMNLIEQTPLYYKLLPNDIVIYEIGNNNKITITKIKTREDQILFGIVESIDENYAKLFFPNLPKFFSLQVLKQSNFKIGTALILKVGDNYTDILHIYDSIENRSNDRELFLNLYKEQSKLCSIIPEYKEDTNPFYTDDFINLTHLDTFNVDPTESKDFDDAISLHNDKIYVHIVDAHDQIKMLSETDINSFKHSFTLYLKEHVENILPKDLAENNMSLVKGEERKTITVEYTINPDTQDIISRKIYKSIIIIKRRYDYEEFNYDLGKYPSLLKFYNKWKRKTLNIPHFSLNIDKTNGKLIDYTFSNYFDESHKIIETLMILTNLTISEHIGTLVPQRYHSKLKKEFELQTFTNNETIDSILSIKQYKPALYDTLHKGHFGLGLDTYTHFTSPIRRYFDVVVHRLLAGISYVNVDEVLNYINRQERYVEKLVDSYNQLKLLSYFEEHNNKLWNGYVMSFTESGVNVILEDTLFEIFIFNPSPRIKLNQIIKEYSYIKVVIKKINWTKLSVKADLVFNV